MLGGIYSNMGIVYYKKYDYNKALECFGKALRIYESKFGAEDKRTLKAKERIEAVKQKMKEQK